MNNRELLETELNKLLQQLNELQLQQRTIQERIPIIVAELGELTSTRGQRERQQRPEAGVSLVEPAESETPVAQRIVKGVQVEEHTPPRERFYNENFQPNVNDEACILNPKPWQGRNGVVQGFTRDGKLKIYTRNRQTIQRLPKTWCALDVEMSESTNTTPARGRGGPGRYPQRGNGGPGRGHTRRWNKQNRSKRSPETQKR